MAIVLVAAAGSTMRALASHGLGHRCPAPVARHSQFDPAAAAREAEARAAWMARQQGVVVPTTAYPTPSEPAPSMATGSSLEADLQQTTNNLLQKQAELQQVITLGQTAVDLRQKQMELQQINAELERMARPMSMMAAPSQYYPMVPSANSPLPSAPSTPDGVSRRDMLPLTIGGGLVGAAAVAAAVGVLGGKSDAPSAAAPAATSVAQALTDIRAGTAESEAARGALVTELAEAATERYFPGAMAGGAVDRAVAATLAKRGYTPANTLFATSVCPDEVNHGPGDLEDRMKARWGEEFYLGGLAGVPFVGSAGFTAYSHHSPTGGKLLVLIAPHIGISADGTVGALSRAGQKNAISKACGATIGSLKAVAKRTQAALLGEAAPPPPPAATFAERQRNEQLGLIINELEKRMKDEPTGPGANQIAYATYMMYEVIREQFIEQLVAAGDTVWDDATELTLLGGIMINRAEGGDRFLPLNFESRSSASGETTVDLFSEAFGPKRGDLSTALGSSARASRAFAPYSLSKLDEMGNARPL